MAGKNESPPLRLVALPSSLDWIFLIVPMIIAAAAAAAAAAAGAVCTVAKSDHTSLADCTSPAIGMNRCGACRNVVRRTTLPDGSIHHHFHERTVARGSWCAVKWVPP